MLNTPVLFLIFNRLETTEQVLAKIKNSQPKQLFVAADGPRPEKAGEVEKCEQVRQWVLDNIDWPCELHTLFREKNLGSGPAVSQAITWFFSHVEKGIILEDDCLPDDSFFGYADEVLHHYESDEKVMHVSGSNLQCGIKRGSASYYFSKYPATWGWATWRRAWNRFSFDFFGDDDSHILRVLKENYHHSDDILSFLKEIEETKNHSVSAWDYQWFYTLLRCKGLSVTPQYNLIINIGFNANGTHTLHAPYWYRYLISKPVYRITHPEKVAADEAADEFYLALTKGRRIAETNYVKLLYRIKRFIRI